MTSGAGDWGPSATGGEPGSVRRWLVAGALGLGALLILVAVTAFALYRVAEGNLERVELPSLADRDDDPGEGGPAAPLNVLVVGSDSREGLSEEEVRELRLGEFDGQRGDTTLLVSISRDREVASVLSLPRDLVVVDGGRERKLADIFADGPDHVLSVLQDNTGVPIHHYVEISIPGFLNIVEAVGGVEICLDEPLRDRRSGADFAAGCHEMSPAEALSYVRSRHSPRGDYDRIERQQRFLAAMQERVISTRTLVDLPRLFDIVDRVSRFVRTDSQLRPTEMRRLAQELRGLAGGDVPMATLPSYAVERDGVSYVVAYEPGARAVFEALMAGEPIPGRGTREEREETAVVVWSSGDPDATDRVVRTLFWAAFEVDPRGRGPMAVRSTTVFALPEERPRAEWVAATLGADVRSFPDRYEAPDGADVVVIVGRDGGADADVEDDDR